MSTTVRSRYNSEDTHVTLVALSVYPELHSMHIH